MKKKFQSIDELIRKCLVDIEKENEKRDKDWWYASELGSCMRKQFLRRLGLEPKEKKWKFVFVAEQGKAIHNWIENILKPTNRLIAFEEDIKDEKLKLKGRFDLIVNLGTEKKPHLSLIDIKTEKSEAFLRRSSGAKKVKEYQKMQLAAYFMYAKEKYKDLRDVRIYYIDRGGGLRQEFILQFNESFFKKVINEINLLNFYWREKKLPPCKHEWTCYEWCDYYRKECKDVENGKLTIDELKGRNKIKK